MENTKRTDNKRWWAVIAISLAVVAFSLDLTVLNLALPTLSRVLHASTGQLEWIVAAYSLALAVLTLPAGLLGDRFGRKKFIVGALIVFGLSSLACAYSGSVNQLIAARIALGVGAAFILPLGMSVIPVFFEKSEQLKAIAVMIGATFLAYPIGPLLGGYLLSHFWWGSVFLINVPIVSVAIIAIGFLLPESKGQRAHRLDGRGIVLSSLGLSGITFGAIQAESHGWTSIEVIGSLTIGVVLVMAFIFWEHLTLERKRQPLVDLKLFGSAGFTWGTVLMTSVSFALFGLVFGLPQYLQSVRGLSPQFSGVLFLPMIGGLMVGSIIATRTSKVLGAKYSAAVGFGVMAVGLMIATRTALNVQDSFVIIWSAIVGLGLGLAMPSTSSAALAALSPERSGSGTATISAIRQVGGTLGVAVLGTILGSAYSSRLLLSSLPSPLAAAVKSSVTSGVGVAKSIHSPLLLHMVDAAFVHGLDVMLWVCSGVAVVAVALALIYMPNGRRQSAQPVFEPADTAGN